jgi:hypothetical protein
MNSKFKSFMFLSLAVCCMSLGATEQTQAEETSCVGTKTKVALGLVGTAAVAYVAYQNRDALKAYAVSGYNWFAGLFAKSALQDVVTVFPGVNSGHFGHDVHSGFDVVDAVTSATKTITEQGFILVGEGVLETAKRPVKTLVALTK